MARLELTLFGSPQIILDGKSISNRVDKGMALIASLALLGPSLNRDALIDFLWSDSPLSKAQNALRTAIWRLKRDELAPWLEVERDIITLNTDHDCWVDVIEFQKNLEQSRQHLHNPADICPNCFPLLDRALELYRGDFMSGYSPHHATGFEEWRTQHGDLLRSDYLTTLERLTKGYYKHARYDQALQTCRRWLALDKYNEEAHNLTMRIYASTGQRANAIAHYRAYTRLVEKKLNIAPSEEISAVYKHILTGKNPPGDPSVRLNTPALVLFDLENSTELTVKHPERIGTFIPKLTALVKSSIHTYGGRILQQNGDHHTAIFERGLPVHSVVAIQQSINKTDWGFSDPISVRMVILTCTKSPAGSLNLEADLQTGTQLIRAISGSRILLSDQAVREYELPVAARVHDLGSYSLPELPTPIQVYELVHPHLTGTPRSELRDLARAPANLPTLPTRFIGREFELVQLAQLLAQPENRLISLVGPGGVGKTRLGIQAITQLHMPPDGVYFVSLAAHQNAATLYEPIANALKVSFNNLGEQSMQLIEHLRDKRILLLLDNFEHLLPGALFISQLLGLAPHLRLIVTSRERLNLHAEKVYEVHGLPYPANPEDPEFDQYSGTKLFLQTAQRVSSGFTLQPADRPSIIRICSLVRGLPLGIELSAAWVHAFTCREIADQIQNSLDFVSTTNLDVPSRHRSLRAAFDHSWALLSAEARQTICKLSVFRNGFSAQAAQALASATPLMLSSYVDKSLVIRQPDGRFDIPETIRGFVTEKLQSDPEQHQALLDAYSEYYGNYLMGMMVKFPKAGGFRAVDEVQQEAENISQALDWAMSRHKWQLLYKAIDPLMAFYEMLGRFREGRDVARKYLQQLFDLAGLRQPGLYYLLLGWDGWFTFHLGFMQEGLGKLSAALDYARGHGRPERIAYTLLILADAHRAQGKYAEAMQEINESLQVLTQPELMSISYLKGIYGYALVIKGLIYLRQQQKDEARQTFHQSLNVLTAAGSRYSLIRLYDSQARLAVIETRYEEARQLRLKALEIAQEYNDRRSIAFMLNNLCEPHEYSGDLPGALAYIEKAVQICDEIGDRQASAVINNNLGFFKLLLKQPPNQAARHYLKSLAMFRELDDKHGIFYTLRDLARAYLLDHNTVHARNSLVEACQMGIRIGQPHLAGELLPLIARLLCHSGRDERAYVLASIYLQLPKTDSLLKSEAETIQSEIRDQARITPDLANAPPSTQMPTFQSLLADLETIPS